MEVNNLSDQDKRNYLAQNGWNVLYEKLHIKDWLYIPKDRSEDEFVPLNLEDAYDVCLKTEEVSKWNEAKKRFVDKEQMINIPMKYYEILRRIEDETRQRDLGQGLSEPERYEEKYPKTGVSMETDTVQKMTETDRVIGRMERLLNRISANTAHLSEITRKFCFDNTAQPTAGDLGVDKTEPRTSIEKLDLLLDEGNRVADRLDYLVKFQSNVI